MNELRDPVTFQRVYSLYSYIYDRSAKIERLPWEWPTENAVQVNVVTRCASLSLSVLLKTFTHQ